MHYLMTTAVAVGLATTALAGEKRGLGSHEHGVGLLNIAIEGKRVVMEFEAPGADIAGFEHAPETADDRAKIDEAIATLAKPLTLFVLPEKAGCSVVEAHAALVGDDEHDHHGGHEHDDEHDHGHHDEHDHDDEHEHAHHDEHDHGDEASHDDHADESAHSEFRAEYAFSCATPSAVDRIDFAYFAKFPNARELEVQLISDRGAQGFEVERDEPVLSLSGAI